MAKRAVKATKSKCEEGREVHEARVRSSTAARPTAPARHRWKISTGGKGSGLAEMTNAGLPVSPGFTISTAVCSIT